MSDNRSCTCHPDEAPKPCQKRYAFSECQADRIEQLEAALRDIIQDSYSLYAISVARAALEGRT